MVEYGLRLRAEDLSLEDFYNTLISEYKARTPKSAELYKRARNVLPGGVTYHIRYFEPYPFYVSHAKGSHIWDIDGNEYIDYWIGHGALILGHANDLVMDKVREILDKGSHWGYEHEYAVRLAEKIVNHVPTIESLRFTNSGTEANMYAIRLARAYTGRKKIVKFEGGWHGGYDSLHIGVKSGRKKGSRGLPDEVLVNTIVAEFNNPSSIEKVFKEHGNDIAAVIVEPVQGAAGIIPADEDFLDALRDLCDTYGSLLIFDEVITGFRLGLGGGQEYYGVRADIVTMGKIIGGGFPIGAFGAPREIMELLDYTKTPEDKRSFHGGTFSGNPVSMIAGYETIKILEKPGFYEYLNWLSGKLAVVLQDIGSRSKIPVHVTYAGSLIGIHFTSEEPRSIRDVLGKRVNPLLNKVFQKYMLVHGHVFLTEDISHLMLSGSHTLREVESFAQFFEEFLKKVEEYL